MNEYKQQLSKVSKEIGKLLEMSMIGIENNELSQRIVKSVNDLYKQYLTVSFNFELEQYIKDNPLSEDTLNKFYQTGDNENV